MQALDPESIKPCYILAKKYGYQGPRMLSCVHKGKRVRDTGRQVHVRPLEETFAEFKYQHLKFILGESWWKAEARKPRDDMHAIMRCAFEYHDVAKKHAPPDHLAGQLFQYVPTSALSELLLLSDDVLRLTISGSGIPESVMDRLRSRDEFHSARYELLVAGMLTRGGFVIEWLDPKLKGGEFQASDMQSGETFCVEAKSRNRPGTLHQPGPRPPEETLKADLDRLFKSALSQCRPTHSNAIFIEANLPMDDDATGDWPYWGTVEDFLGRIPRRIERKAANAFFICVTANGWHWRPTAKVQAVPAVHAFLSPCNHLPSNPNTLVRLIAATAFPPKLPEDIYE